MTFEAVALRMLCGDLRGQGSDFDTGRADRRTRFQTANHGHRVAPAVGLGAEREWKVEVEVATWREHRREIE
jgi:hypothetical protein